jgi:hypothetical protein
MRDAFFDALENCRNGPVPGFVPSWNRNIFACGGKSSGKRCRNPLRYGFGVNKREFDLPG